MDWSRCSAVDRNPGKLGGKGCFRSTRLPPNNLFPKGTNPLGQYVLIGNAPFLVIGVASYFPAQK